MCKFDQAWIGKCKEENVEGATYCEKHVKIVCSVCGEQATHDCGETMQFVCGTPLCGKLACKLQHFYQAHGYALFELEGLEEKLGKVPFKIVVGKMDFGKGDMEEFATKHYEGQLHVMILTTLENNQFKFYKSHYMYFAKHKDEIPELFKSTFYERVIEEKGVYYSDTAIQLKELYTEETLPTLEKVM